MSNRIPLPIKFSNLLQANPESCLYGLDLTTTSNLQHGNIIVERIKRKSVNLGSLKSKRAVESFSPQNETSKIQNLINKSKIKRLLFEANFDKSDISNAKKKKMYVIRKRQEKSKLGKQKRSQTQNNQQEISLTKYQQNSLRVNTQPSDKIFQQIFKIKRKVPKFGIQNIAPKIALRKHSLYTKKTPDLFSSTSSNSFYNTSFYMNSKIKQALSAKQQARIKINQLSPQIKNLIPHPINNDRFLEKKKQLQKFYTTNFGSFGFSRSKTQEIQPNMICGWQKQSSDNQNYTEGLN